MGNILPVKIFNKFVPSNSELKVKNEKGRTKTKPTKTNTRAKTKSAQKNSDLGKSTKGKEIM
jgi:hypothetical protein